MSTFGEGDEIPGFTNRYKIADRSYTIMEWHSVPVEILIMNVHHGKIEIENNPAMGATVRLFFDNQKRS